MCTSLKSFLKFFDGLKPTVKLGELGFFKKLYFSTSYYNNSLNSKIPIQVFFNPNPFLLSLISPYTKKSFNLNEVSPNDFWLEKKNKQIYQYHNYLWLSTINRKTDEKHVQKIIYLWIIRNSHFKKKVWQTSTLSSRVISWMLNIDLIIKNNCSKDMILLHKKYKSSVMASIKVKKKDVNRWGIYSIKKKFA